MGACETDRPPSGVAFARWVTHPNHPLTSRASQKGWRRSICVLQRYTQMPTLLENFDYPQMGPNCVLRGESLVAPQALHLMNNKMVYQLAEHFAARGRREVGDERPNART